MTDSITTNLVGAHFRPPAKALLACLPAGQQLYLRPEPTNEYDENAVQVLLRSSDIPHDTALREELENQLAGQGYEMEQILGEVEWHLGYIPKAAKGNAELEAWNVGVQRAVHEICGTEVPPPADQNYSCVACQLSFDSAGKPTVIIPWPPKAAS